MTKWLLAWIFLIGAFTTLDSQATVIHQTQPFTATDSFGLSPFWDWRVIESENFRVIFPTRLKETAQRSTHYLEETHQFLSPILRWQPQYKTQILLIDNSDLPNGLTAPILRIGLVLWVTPPENWESNGYYDDWLRLLIIHEYTHFLNMDATSSFWTPLRYVFGDAALPNSAWAPWMLEGLAVYNETRFTTAGRGRSPYYEMVLRAAVEENTFNTNSFVTLDRISGTNPYFPGGDTRYHFGYQLMNELAHQDLKGMSHDGETPIQSAEDILGVMSQRSSGRVPFFINGNVENITGKDWYTFWNEWVEKTQTRMRANLAIIHSQPVTSFTLLTEKNHFISNQVLGSAVSPNGKWLAYTNVSSDRRMGLYLRNQETGKLRRLDDKINGAGMRFTPDSQALVYSELRRKSQYDIWSDLRIFNLEKTSSDELTHNLRARDPDVSRDGKWVTFTVSENGTTKLAIAPLVSLSHGYELGSLEIIYSGLQYDHVANPQFSIEGNKVYFSHHPNGKSQEDILEYDRETHQTAVVFSDGKYNRFPAVSPSGDLYFVSNLTGVDNLYRCASKIPSLKDCKTTIVTNLTTGLRLPTFDPSSTRPILYAGVFSSTGWDLAQVQLLENPVTTESITVEPPPAPASGAHSVSDPTDPIFKKIYEDKPYSIYPSILPRAWSPLIGWGPQGIAAGAELIGFDALNQHRYLLAGSYESQLQQVDGYAVYSNRSFGPSLTLSGGSLTSNIAVNPNTQTAVYSRQFLLSGSASYPILWTYSNLVPTLSANLQQSFNYQTTQNLSQASLINVSQAVPSFDASLSFSNLETSNLSFTNEGGRTSILGTRVYLTDTAPIWKALLFEQESIRLAKHTVLAPSLKATWVSQTSSSYLPANALLAGRMQGNQFGPMVVNPFLGDNFNQLTIRGYPSYYYISRGAAVAALDLSFPIGQVFRGWGTNLAFLDQFYGFAFGELSTLSFSDLNLLLPSLGGGLRVTTELFYFPMTFSTEYHAGLRKDLRGADDLFFQVIISALSF